MDWISPSRGTSAAPEAAHQSAACARSAQSYPADPHLDQELASLPGLSLDELRVRWRKLFRSTAPAHLPKFLLVRIVAYKLQAQANSDLDRETVRLLARIAREQKRAAKKGIVPPISERGRLKPGTLLIREHGGVLHKVTVVEGGFSWGETTYGSLSEVARAITGTNWNGPRFFGLRDTPITARLAKACPGGTQGEEVRP